MRNECVKAPKKAEGGRNVNWLVSGCGQLENTWRYIMKCLVIFAFFFCFLLLFFVCLFVRFFRCSYYYVLAMLVQNPSFK